MKRTILVLICAVGFVGAQEAEVAVKRHSLAQLVPANSMMMMEFTDQGGVDRWAETALGKIAAEPEVQKFFAGILASIDAAYQNAGVNVLGMLGLTEEDIQGIALSHAGMALVDFQLNGRMPTIDAVISVEATKGGEKLAKILGALRNAAGMFLPVQFKDAEVAGVAMHTIEIPNHVVHVYAGNNRVVITTNRARMESVLAAAKAPMEKALHGSGRYAQVRSRMNAKNHAMMMYFDVPQIFERGMGIAQRMDANDAQEFQQMWNLMGLDSLDAVAFAEIPQGQGYRTEFAITHRERRGVFTMFQAGQASHRFAKFAPADALIYGAERQDLGVTFDNILAWIKTIEPGITNEIDEGMAEINKHLGIDLRKDLLGSLGADWGFYLGAPFGGGIIPDAALYVSLKDKPHFRKTVGTMLDNLKRLAAEERVSLTVGATKFRGYDLEYVEIAESDGDPIPVTPSWAFGEDFVVFGAWPHTVKNAIMNKQDSMANKADFVRLSGETPRTAAQVMYIDAKKLMGWLYNTATPILQGLAGAANRQIAQFNPNVRINLADMPPADVILKHLGGAMTYWCVEPDCIRMGFVSDYGMAFIALPVAAVAGIAVPVMVMEEGSSEARRARWRMMDAERENAEMRARLRRMEVQAERTRQQLGRERNQNDTMKKRLADLERQIAELKKLLEDK